MSAYAIGGEGIPQVSVALDKQNEDTTNNKPKKMMASQFKYIIVEFDRGNKGRVKSGLLVNSRF